MASHPSRPAATCSPPFSSSFRNSSTDQEELSGAYYIRSLVKKHLSSSSSSPARSQEDHHLNTMTNNTIPHDQQPQLQQEQSPVVLKPQMKKQARRRTHASRPYQERLLNMAEARREIVTALKIHRATMRQQPCTYQHHQEPLLLRQPPIQQEHQQQQGQVVFRDRSQAAVEEEAPLMAPTSYAASFADHQLRNPLGQWVAAATPAGSYYYPSSVRPYDPTPLEAPTAMGGLDQLARSLPAQPLGLNLSFQGFGGSVDGAKDCEDLFGVPSIRSSPPAASSYSAYSPPATETASGTHGSPALSTAEKYPPSVVDAPAAFVAPVLDDMETQPAGEMQQGVEWWGEATAADVAAASAWWSKILLESMEVGGGEVAEGGAAGCAADDVATTAAAAGLPAEWRWLCEVGVGAQGAVTGADGKTPDVLETTHADGDYSTCCYEGVRRSDDGGDGIAAFPCMDGIEGWDGEWFSCSS